MGKCNAANTTAFVEKMCVGKKSCMFPVNTETFGDPCVGTTKTFAVQVSEVYKGHTVRTRESSVGQVTCNISQNHTYWDFSVIDPMMEDFMEATANHSVIINFSTIPAWIYKTSSRVVYPDNPGHQALIHFLSVFVYTKLIRSRSEACLYTGNGSRGSHWNTAWRLLRKAGTL